MGELGACAYSSTTCILVGLQSRSTASFVRKDADTWQRHANPWSVWSSTTVLPAVYDPGNTQHRLAPYLRRMDDDRPAILMDEEQANWRANSRSTCTSRATGATNWKPTRAASAMTSVTRHP